MTAEHNPPPEPGTRHYGLPNYPVTITSGQVTATVRPWYGFGKRTSVANLSDYAAVGYRIVGRAPYWWSRSFVFYHQVILVHREKRSRNIPLAEIFAGLGWDPSSCIELRIMMEKCGQDLALPVIEWHYPPRKRPRDAATPEQVFETRLPDELNLSVRDLVLRGRLALSRDVAAPPRGLTIARHDRGLQLTFRYSALWETLRIAGFVFLIAIIAIAARRHHHSLEWELWALAIGCGAPTALAFLIVFPIECAFNGNELLLAEDRWAYRPATGSLLWPSVQVLSQFKPSEIEGIRRRGRDVLVLSDREIVRIRCRSRRMAKWMEQALLTVAAYGLSALDGCVSETGDAQAGATGAPASSAV